jgi:hypothetical protein
VVDSLRHNFIFKNLSNREFFIEKFAFFPYLVEKYADTSEKLMLIQDYIDKNNFIGKRTILLFGHDCDYPISEFLRGNPIVFRYSMSKNFIYKDEYAIPFVEVRGFRELASRVDAFPWQSRPKVSFMGWAKVPNPRLFFRQEGKAIDDVSRKKPITGLVSPEVFPTPASIGVVLRKKSIEYLSDDDRLDTNFKINDMFFYHHSDEQQRQKIDEYVDLMCNTHYVLAPRGCGNYSMRLYETLSISRIPIMIDTNQFLPFEDKIPWNELGVWVPLDKFSSISQILVAYHEEGGQVGFQERTEKISDIYDRYLSREACVKIIEKILENYL